ncbi:MAG TPA: hypothetical protein VGJ54_18185 [Streptosporangiaceae bacterium]|jgi:hypothetical protein
MYRKLATLLATLALTLGGLIAAAPAQAATTTDVTITAGCDFKQRWTFYATTYFNPGDCYQTPAATLVMQDDGNFVLYDARWNAVWASNTEGYDGAYAVFQDDGNLVVYWYGWPLWASNTWGNPGSRLILRGGDGHLLIRNAAGTVIWEVP